MTTSSTGCTARTTRAGARARSTLAREAGIDELVARPDLRAAARSRARLDRRLEPALELEPPHISLYGLTVEPHTPLGRWRERGEVPRADEERYEAEFLEADDALTAARASSTTRSRTSRRPGSPCRAQLGVLAAASRTSASVRPRTASTAAHRRWNRASTWPGATSCWRPGSGRRRTKCSTPRIGVARGGISRIAHLGRAPAQPRRTPVSSTVGRRGLGCRAAIRRCA